MVSSAADQSTTSTTQAYDKDTPAQVEASDFDPCDGEPQKVMSSACAQGVTATASFGSTVTDFDYMYNPGSSDVEAQARLYDDMPPSTSFGSNRGNSFGANPPTTSFGSAVTDFDEACAKRDADYLSRYYPDGLPPSGLHMPPGVYPGMASGHMPFGYGQPMAMGMPFPGWGGYIGQAPSFLSPPTPDAAAAAAQLDDVAAHYRALAHQAEEHARAARQSVSHSHASVRGGAAGARKAAPPAASADDDEDDDAVGGEVAPEARTTVMLRNLPNDYKREDLLELLDEESFEAKYDFVYLPVDFKRWAGLGYAFVNMISHDEAIRAIGKLNGYAKWKKMSHKVLELAWGEPLQGLQQHIARYRNSPVMHPDVPDVAKPIIFKDGQRITFPSATKRLRPPRVKR